MRGRDCFDAVRGDPEPDGGQAMGTALGLARPAAISRTRRAVVNRISSGHVVMMLAGALGVLLTLTALHSADHTEPVLVAARDLAPGSIIADDSVRVARVHVDGPVGATLFQ